jgi:transcriptional regulator with XRE-family HTH domain
MPVFESHLYDYGSWGTGRRICEERQRLGLTLQDLASRCRLSTARLSQIENGLYIPDVAQAHDIACALGRTIDFLLPSDRALPYQVRRYREVRESAPLRVGGTDPQPCELWPLADLFVGRQLEPILVRLNPGRAPLYRHHPGLEFAFVLKGRVEFLLKTSDEEHREELQRGDCIYIRSHHPHTFRCLDAQPAECIHVLSSPSAGGLSGFEWLPDASAARRNGESVAKGRTPTETEVPALLGIELAALRRARGWTIPELAQIANIKERQVEQVEKGDRPPPLDVLVRFARAFGRPLRELLHDPGEERPYYYVRRSSEIPGLPARPRRLPTDRPNAPMPNSYHPLFNGFPTVHMYPYLVRIRNVDMQMLMPHDHHGQEFMYVLGGEIELLTYAEDTEVSTVLGPGDSCFLDATVPHLLRGETRNPYSASSAELIDVYWCSLGEQYLFDTAQIGSEVDLADAGVLRNI